MDFGFLSEYWDSISSTTITAWEYSESWFENIGLAVAGAVGNLFYSLLHNTNDLFVFLGWVFDLFKNLIAIFFLPLTYVFSFLKAFLLTAFSDPVEFTEVSWDPGVLTLFQTIPLWDELIIVLAIGMSIIVLFNVLKLFRGI